MTPHLPTARRFRLPFGVALFYCLLMSSSSIIVCKPTPWFLRRALGMFVMFTFLGVWFYRDASTGYRKQNEIHLINLNFSKAAAIFQEQSKAGAVDAQQWKTFAAAQTIDFGDDLSLIPANVTTPMPWPQELQDQAIITKGSGQAWDQFTERMKWDRTPPEKLHDQRSIREQWYYCIGLGVLAVVTLFVFLRTLRRKIVVDHEKIITQQGKTVFFHELSQLDLRKWASKGLAFGQYSRADGSKGKIRFDGLTYGGFQKEQGEPAEQMLQRVRANFHGEVIEYADEDQPKSPDSDISPTADPEKS